ADAAGDAARRQLDDRKLRDGEPLRQVDGGPSAVAVDVGQVVHLVRLVIPALLIAVAPHAIIDLAVDGRNGAVCRADDDVLVPGIEGAGRVVRNEAVADVRVGRVRACGRGETQCNRPGRGRRRHCCGGPLHHLLHYRSPFRPCNGPGPLKRLNAPAAHRSGTVQAVTHTTHRDVWT